MTIDPWGRLRHARHADSTPLFLALGINAFGAGMFFPFALIYYQAVTSLTVASIGLALTSATLVTLLVTPVTGILVDRLGARQLVVSGNCLEAAGFLAYLAVSSTTSLLAAALLATAGTRMFYASFSSLIAESVADHERDRWYGLVGITQGIGASASGALASLLIGSAGVGGFRIIIVANACCLLVSASLIRITKTVRPTHRVGREAIGYRSILRDRIFMLVVCSNLLFVLCSMLSGIGFAIYATEALGAPIWSIGAIGAVQTVLVVGMQTRVTRWMSAVRRTRTMSIAGAIWILASLGIAAGALVPPTVIVPYLFVTSGLLTVAQLLYTPASRALAAGIGPSHARGRYIATYELSWGIAAAASPATFGVVYAIAPPAPWLLMTGLLAIGVTILPVVESGIPRSRNRPERVPVTVPPDAMHVSDTVGA